MEFFFFFFLGGTDLRLLLLLKKKKPLNFLPNEGENLESRDWFCRGRDVSNYERLNACQIYDPGQNCWDNSRFPPSPHCNVDLSRSPKSRSVHRSLACFHIVWGEGGRKKGSERRKRIAHITMEVCTVNFLLFAQNLTSVPKSFDPDCSSNLRSTTIPGKRFLWISS